MDVANLAAQWLSTVATIVGLGSLYNILRKLPSPSGPLINASLEANFCGHEIVYLTPTPTKVTGNASCSVLLGVLHLTQRGLAPQRRSSTWEWAPSYAATVDSRPRENSKDSELELTKTKTNSSLQRIISWDVKEKRQLVLYSAVPVNTSLQAEGLRHYVTISRSTLMTLLVVSSVRLMQCLRGPSGLRYVYRGYTGIFLVDWPLGAPATVHFSLLDTRTSRDDVYPRGFYRNVRHAIHMLCGTVDDGKRFRVHVGGRSPAGTYMLQYVLRGLNGTVAARDLYDTMGGNVYETDLLSAVALDKVTAVEMEGVLQLQVPALDETNAHTIIYVLPAEQRVLAELMDKLPWTQLAWPMHRGLRDLVVAYGKSLWNAYRKALANTLRNAVMGREHLLINQGWRRQFVYENLASVVENGILRDGGSLTRAVTSVALLLWNNDDTNDPHLHETVFWRNALGANIAEVDADAHLEPDTVIALCKLYTVQCSYEFDYGVYQDLPIELLMY